MPFLSPNQQCQSTEGKISHSMDLITPSSPGGLPTLPLTTNSSWLPWGGLPCLSSALWCQYPNITATIYGKIFLHTPPPQQYCPESRCSSFTACVNSVSIQSQTWFYGPEMCILALQSTLHVAHQFSIHVLNCMRTAEQCDDGQVNVRDGHSADLCPDSWGHRRTMGCQQCLQDSASLAACV